MPPFDRRSFLRAAAAYSAGFLGLRRSLAGAGSPAAGESNLGYGPLLPDPLGLLDLPRGFAYSFVSPQGSPMAGGLVVPGHHDGMVAVASGDGRILLVRNHELEAASQLGAFGPNNELLGAVDRSSFFDFGHGLRPSLGAVTTTVYDPSQRRGVQVAASLLGTLRNCSGGVTPWGTWLTCEESTQRADSAHERDHGWVFEVPISAAPVLATPRPLVALGRFNHEAAIVDPATGIVYMTEDRDDSVLYRLVPNVPGDLAAGGRLQALLVHGAPGLDTSNHGFVQILVGQRFDVGWVDLRNPASPNDDLRLQAVSKGAARFARGEGMWWGRDGIYFVCTEGGASRFGQVWRLEPPASPVGGPGFDRLGGGLELFIESHDARLIHRCDAITATPRGHLAICEDNGGVGGNRVVGVAPSGAVYPIARNSANPSELAGAVFSPDGSTLFVNILYPGVTFAVTGPW